MSNNQLYLLVTIAMLLWGANWSVAKFSTQFAAPFELIFWRFLITALCFIPFIYKKWKTVTFNGPTLLLLGISSICMTLYQLFFFIGLQAGLAGIGGILVTTTNPIIAFIITSFLLKQAPKLNEIAALSLGVLSALLLTQVWALSTDSLFSSGNIYFLCAAFMWALVSVLSHKLTIPTDIFTFVVYIPGILIGLLGHIWLTDTLPSLKPFPFWICILYMSLFGTLFASTLYFLGVKQLGVKRGSSFILVVPGSAMLTSYLALGEPITWFTLMGGTLGVSAVYLLNKAPNR
jgi:drug/metabolite transporter (DMT)-like permease